MLAVEPAYGLLAGNDASHGLGANLSAWAGISEAFWLTASVGELVFFDKGGGRRALTEAGAGLIVAFDVLRTIPFAELVIGINATAVDAIVPTFRAGIGADYLLSKNVSVGGVARFRPLSDKIAGNGLLTLQLRLAWRFEL